MFGQSLSISGDVAVIGDAWVDEIAADAGVAYVFRRTKAGWLAEQKLTGSDATVNDGFGWSVAVDRDTILVASIGHEHGVKGSGWAYVFRYDGTDWVEEDHFTGADSAIGDQFGNLVALKGDRALVGAPYHDDPAENIGAAYVFRREGTKWVQEAKLVPQDGQSGDMFAGASLAFNGRHAMVAPSWLGPSFGRAYIFERSGTSWGSGCRVTPGGGNPMALSHEYAFVHARDSVFVYSLLGLCYSLVNHASFQRCFGDEGTLAPVGCEEFDFDLDGNVDLDDYARFREHLVGPGDSCQ